MGSSGSSCSLSDRLVIRSRSCASPVSCVVFCFLLWGDTQRLALGTAEDAAGATLIRLGLPGRPHDRLPSLTHHSVPQSRRGQPCQEVAQESKGLEPTGTRNLGAAHLGWSQWSPSSCVTFGPPTSEPGQQTEQPFQTLSGKSWAHFIPPSITIPFSEALRLCQCRTRSHLFTFHSSFEPGTIAIFPMVHTRKWPKAHRQEGVESALTPESTPSPTGTRWQIHFEVLGLQQWALTPLELGDCPKGWTALVRWVT